MAGPADGVRAQPQGLGECAVGAPSTQRSSADADAVEHVGHSQHGFGGDPWRHFSFPHSRRRPRRGGRRGGRPGSARLAARRRWRCQSHQRSFAPPSWGPGGVIWWSWAQGYEVARNAQERSRMIPCGMALPMARPCPSRPGVGYVPGRVGCVPVASLVVECRSSWSGFGALAGGCRRSFARLSAFLAAGAFVMAFVGWFGHHTFALKSPPPSIGPRTRPR